nr:uncharacterized protein LOC113715935 [Coffea arabica]
MTKAYDRVEWYFLQAMMQKMGFCTKWINRITSCMKTVTYSFNCNGETKGIVTPGFSNLLRKAEERNEIKGLRISRQGPIITHIFFADDSLIFCKTNMQQANEIMKILKTYEEALGQLINLDRSSVFFSKNMPLGQRKEVCSSLGGRTKDQIFGFIRENIKRKLQDWRNKLLSTAGKEVILKAVSMSMPTYAMSCFKLPRKLCKDISALKANYWWGETNGKNKMHWLSWRKMLMKRNEGGLVFKDLEAFNKALLGK